MGDAPTLGARSGPHRVEVAYHQFLVFAVGCDDNYVPDVIDPREWVRSGSGWLHVLTGAPDGPADVTLEAWIDPPDRPEGDWDGIRELTMEVPEPTVIIWAITGGPQSEPVRIGDASGPYHVRLSCKDRPDGDPAPTDPPETWLIQFWSAAEKSVQK